VQLQPLAGEDEQRRLADVEDRVAHALEKLRHEQVGDDEGRILPGLGEALERLLERVTILAIELRLARARVLGLLRAAVRERGDDLVEGGQGHARGAREIERNRARGQPRQILGLLGDVDGIVAELFEVQCDAEDAAQAPRARAARGLTGDPLEAGLLDRAEEVVDLIVLVAHARRQRDVLLEEGRHGGHQLRLDKPRHQGEVLAQVFQHHDGERSGASGRRADRRRRGARAPWSPPGASSRFRAPACPCAPCARP
jgi:hypothetical protein